MKKLFFLIFTAFVINNVYVAEIAYFNPSILGKNVNTPFELFQIEKNQKSTILYPTNIQLDIKNNICTAVAMLFPDNKINLDEMRKIINTKYPDSEYIVGESFWAWRVKAGKFTITMYPEEDCIEDHNFIRVSYMAWGTETDESLAIKAEKVVEYLEKNNK